MLSLMLSLMPSPPSFAGEEEPTGCREELIFQIVRPKLGELLKGIRRARTLTNKLTVEEDSQIATAIETHLAPLETEFKSLMRVQETIRGILQDALKARRSKRKERTDELVHDLGNMLAPISYTIAILKMKAPATVDKHRATLAVIHTGFDKADKLIREMIIPVLNEARFVPQKVLVNVNDVLSTIHILYRTSEPQVSVTVGKGDLEILANDLDLFTAISNLCKNAQEAIQSQQNGRGEITVRAYREATFVVIEVKDNGPGIPETAQARILQRNESFKGEGRGVGLSSVQRTVFDNDGEFLFTSSTKPEDHGSVFQLRFPAPKKD